MCLSVGAAAKLHAVCDADMISSDWNSSRLARNKTSEIVAQEQLGSDVEQAMI